MHGDVVERHPPIIARCSPRGPKRYASVTISPLPGTLTAMARTQISFFAAGT